MSPNPSMGYRRLGTKVRHFCVPDSSYWVAVIVQFCVPSGGFGIPRTTSCPWIAHSPPPLA